MERGGVDAGIRDRLLSHAAPGLESDDLVGQVLELRHGEPGHELDQPAVVHVQLFTVQLHLLVGLVEELPVALVLGGLLGLLHRQALDGFVGRADVVAAELLGDEVPEAVAALELEAHLADGVEEHRFPDVVADHRVVPIEGGQRRLVRVPERAAFPVSLDETFETLTVLSGPAAFQELAGAHLRGDPGEGLGLAAAQMAAQRPEIGFHEPAVALGAAVGLQGVRRRGEVRQRR